MPLFLIEERALNCFCCVLEAFVHSLTTPDPTHPICCRDVMTASTLNNLGVLLKGEGKLQEAHTSYTEALDIRR